LFTLVAGDLAKTVFFR